MDEEEDQGVSYETGDYNEGLDRDDSDSEVAQMTHVLNAIDLQDRRRHGGDVRSQDSRNDKGPHGSDDRRLPTKRPAEDSRYSSQYSQFGSSATGKLVEYPPSGRSTIDAETLRMRATMPCTLNLTGSCTRKSCMYSHDDGLRKRYLRTMIEVDAEMTARAAQAAQHAATLPPPAPPERRGATRAEPGVASVSILRRSRSHSHGDGADSAGRAVDSDSEVQL